MRTFLHGIVLLSVLAGVFALDINCYGEDDGRSGSYSHAVDLLENGVIFEAIHELELYVEDNPDDEVAYMLLARTLPRLKRDRRTAVAAAHVLRINPDNAEARRLLTQIRIKLGRDLDRSNPVAILDYARLCARPETYDRAADFYNLYLEQDDDPLVHMEFAKMLYWAGNYVDAKRHLLIYIDDKPDDNVMRGILGNIYNAMGEFDSAVEQYRLCVEGVPDDVEMQLNLVRALLWGGHEEEAGQLLDAIRKRSDKYDAPLLLLASIARMEGRTDDEYNLYKDVLKTSPENKEALEHIAMLESGSTLEVASLLSRLALNRDDIESRRQLVSLYLSENRYGESIPHLEVLNHQTPMDLEIAEELRAVREKEGELSMVAVNSFYKSGASAHEDIISKCKKWLKGNPNDYRTRVRLADALVANNHYELAINQLETLMSMTPTDMRISERLQQVRLLANANAAEGNDQATADEY